MTLAVAAAYADAVDLDRYPINALESAVGRSMVEQGRDQLARLGVCSLPGFVRPDAVYTMVAIAESRAAEAWRSGQTHTAYFEPPDPTVATSDPRARLVRSAKRALACDLIPADAPLRRLYESDDMTRFIAAVLDKPVLFRSADPLDCLEIAMFGDGDELGWHFDRSEFSVTMMLRPAECGGAFDYYPSLRTPADERYGAVGAALDDDGANATRLVSEPGTLAVFRGHHALHRVAPVSGAMARINAVLTYGDRADMKLNELTQRLFYGRVA